jgi:hypothetical protein
MGNYKKGVESPLFIDLKNKRFGNLVAKEFVSREYENYKENCWICDCDCGNTATVRTNHLNNGKRTMCPKCVLKKNAEKRIRPENATIIERVFRNYKRAAKNRKYEFLISEEKFRELIFSNCYYCGSEPRNNPSDELVNKSGLEFKRNGIDRLINSIGYTNENVVPCCGLCNTAKMTLDHDDFLNLIDNIYKNILEKRSTTIPQGSTEQANGSGNGFDPSK